MGSRGIGRRARLLAGGLAVVAGALAPAGPSRAADPAISVTRDVLYATGPATTLDVYRADPPPATPAPGVLLIHGGGWVGGDKSGEGLVAAAVVKSGMVAFAVNYDLAGPGHPTWPAAFKEVVAAVRWVKANAATYGVDPGRIGALGDSAGGQLAALLATSASGPNDTGAGVLAAVSWSGPMDLAALDASEGSVACPRAGACLPRTLRDSLRQFMGCAPADCPAAYASASPALAVRPGDPPVLLYNSSHELVPVIQASIMSVKLRGAGVVNRVVVLDGSQHGTDYAPRVTQASVTFLHNRLLGLADAGPARSALGGWWGWIGAAAILAALAALIAADRRRRSYTWF